MTATRNDEQFAGISITESGIGSAMVTGSGEVVREVRSDRPEGGRNVLEKTLELISEVRGSGPLSGVGICVPGLVNHRTKRIEVAPALPDLVDLDIAGDVSKATSLPVILDNDANAAAFGELQSGAAQGRRNVFFVSLGSTVGSGIIIEGEVYRGASGFAGEFGHITIDPEGIECAFGNIGCLETFASAPNIVRRTRERLYRDRTSSLSRLAVPRDREFTAEDIAHAAHEGDEMAVLMMERTGMFLGIGLAAVINLLNVDTIVLGGTIMEAGALILNAAVKEARRRAFPPCFAGCNIVLARLGSSAPVIGAALLARDSRS